jgi:Predicted membrane protein (DUF2254)
VAGREVKPDSAGGLVPLGLVVQHSEDASEDVSFAVDRLLEIAIRAPSPAINDMVVGAPTPAAGDSDGSQFKIKSSRQN